MLVCVIADNGYQAAGGAWAFFNLFFARFLVPFVSWVDEWYVAGGVKTQATLGRRSRHKTCYGAEDFTIETVSLDHEGNPQESAARSGSWAGKARRKLKKSTQREGG